MTGWDKAIFKTEILAVGAAPKILLAALPGICLLLKAGGLKALFGGPFLWGLLYISCTDVLRGKIYNRDLLPLALTGICYRVVTGEAPAALGGLVLALTLFSAIFLLSRGGMGGGDVKFAAVLGVWLGWEQLLPALNIAFITGALSGGSLLLTGSPRQRLTIPFGPFMSLGAFAVFIGG